MLILEVLGINIFACEVIMPTTSPAALHRPPPWHRFGPSPAKSHSEDVLPIFSWPCYPAQVEDAYYEREFQNIVSKKYINTILVDWVLSLCAATLYI
jgi:hypothetical protein